MSADDYDEYDLDPFFEDVLSGVASDSTRLKTEVCVHFFNWYNSFQPNKPSYAQFEILDHLKYAPNVMLLKLLDSGEYEYRIQGELVYELVGKRNQGKIFSKQSEVPYLSRLAIYLDAIALKNNVIHSYGKLTAHDRPHVLLEALALPLVDANNRVTHILSLLSPIPQLS